MSFNTFGKIFRFTTWGESHGPAIGCIVDGCPPNIPISEREIQKDMDKRRPGQSKFTTQRKESDKVSILSGVFQGKTTGTPIFRIIGIDRKSLTKLLYSIMLNDYKFKLINFKGKKSFPTNLLFVFILLEQVIIVLFSFGMLDQVIFYCFVVGLLLIDLLSFVLYYNYKKV